MSKPDRTAPGGRGVRLADLRNVGPAFVDKFELLGITSVEQLVLHDADDLYVRLCHLEGERLDPCVHDVFAATVHQANTGEALDWWTFTKGRTDRQSAGDFPDL